MLQKCPPQQALDEVAGTANWKATRPTPSIGSVTSNAPLLETGSGKQQPAQKHTVHAITALDKGAGAHCKARRPTKDKTEWFVKCPACKYNGEHVHAACSMQRQLCRLHLIA